MSEKLLRFFLLSEVRTVRLVCKHPGCEAVTEIPIGHLDKRFPDGCCPVCKAPFKVIEPSGAHWPAGVNWLMVLSQTIAALSKGDVKVDIEFPLPAKEICRLDRADG
jgi:hypothetical protein